VLFKHKMIAICLSDLRNVKNGMFFFNEKTYRFQNMELIDRGSIPN